ncbi:glycosyl hydrolase family 61-domain-containing protein [Cladochytrium replicatum]|nr:glycosyl hydrolase family 61-domain-containing protein [Cladochytrium replicatum]
MMNALVVFLVMAGSFANLAAAHFYVEKLNGSQSPLRPIALQLGGENSPVQGDQIENDDMICNVARPFSAFASAPLTVAAGDTVTMHWTTTPNSAELIGAGHYGQGLKPTGWTKIFETTPDNSNDWCTNVVANNNNDYLVKIPSFLAPGDYVLRVHLAALHAAGSPGGAQFYIRCMDIKVTGSGTQKPPFELQIPGTWNKNTPGVLFDLYTISNPANGALYKGKYPSWGGSLWSGGGSSGGGSTTTTTRATTTTTSRATSVTPATRSTSTTTTTVTRTTTTTAASPAPTSGACATKYQQCGGQNWTGPKCCVAGSTCTAQNAYYSQCV